MARKKSPGNRAVIYARASSDKQEHSTSDQIELCKLILGEDYPGLDIVGILADEDSSGFYIDLQDRDKGEELWAMATHKEFDVLVLFELSRLARNTREGLTIVDELITRYGINVIVVGDAIDTRVKYDPSEMAERFLSAEKESLRMSERIKARMRLIKRSIAGPKGYYLTRAGNKMTALGNVKGCEYDERMGIGRWRKRKAWLISLAPRLIGAARSDILETGRKRATWKGMASRLNFEGLEFESHLDKKASGKWTDKRVWEAIHSLKRMEAFEEAWLTRPYVMEHTLEQTVAQRDFPSLRRAALEGKL